MHRRTPSSRALIAAALTVAICRAAVPGEVSLKAELAGVKGPATIQTRKFITKGEDTFLQLVVRDARGREIWSGPRNADLADPLVFCWTDTGVSLPECVGDIDGDGHVELVAPAPQSDVSPVTFRVLRWSGTAFVPVRVAALLEKPEGSGLFPWNPAPHHQGRWVAEIQKAERGQLTAKLTDYRGGESALLGSAVLQVTREGYRVARWIEPMRTPPDRQ